MPLHGFTLSLKRSAYLSLLTTGIQALTPRHLSLVITRSIRHRSFSYDNSSTHTAILARFPRQRIKLGFALPFRRLIVSIASHYDNSSSDALYLHWFSPRNSIFDISFTYKAILAKFPRQLNSSALLCPSGFFSSLSLLSTAIQAPAPSHLSLWSSPCPPLF